MKSNKQKRAEIMAARQARRARQAQVARVDPRALELPRGTLKVSPALLRPSGSYSTPDFVRRGYYQDLPFRCIDCGVEGVWSAERQRWWYEVAKGDIFTTARRCAACRARERARREEARRVHQEGLARKRAERASLNQAATARRSASDMNHEETA